MVAENGALGLNARDTEILLCISLTVNFCMMWNLAVPIVCRLICGKEDNRTASTDTLHEATSELPCRRRFTTNLLFHFAMPVCGFLFLFKTDILQNPFLAFDNKFRIIFSISLGHYVFKSAEVIIFRQEVVHHKPLLVHHLVAITTYATIVHYEQNTVLGVIGLFLEGNLVFAELEHRDVICVLEHARTSKLWKVAMVTGALVGVVIKGLVPGFLVVFTFMKSSSDILKMNYVPLAFFFLGLVFFTAVNVWFFKDTFTEIFHHFRRPIHLSEIFVTHQKQPLTNVINHGGLSKLCHATDHTVHITCNNLWGHEVAAESTPLKEKNMDVIPLDDSFLAVLRTTCIVSNVTPQSDTEE